MQRVAAECAYVRTLQLTGYHFDGGLPVVNNEIHLNEQVVITGETNLQLPSGGQIGSGVKLQIVPTVLLADMSLMRLRYNSARN